MLMDDALLSANSNKDGQHFCWACAQSFDAFEAYGQPARPGRCPRCGAKPGHRAIVWYPRHALGLGSGPRVLQIGAAKFAIRNFLTAHYLGQATYTALDLRCLKHHRALSQPHGFARGSAIRLPFAPASFGVIL